jgi:hypothetical protein
VADAVQVEPPYTLPAAGGRPTPSLKPAIASNDLRTQFAEGRALREGHYRNLSNSSFIEAISPVQTHMPPLQDLRLQNRPVETGNMKDVFSPTRPDFGNDEDPPGGWV